MAIVRGGELCGRRCRSDAGCRAERGSTCDPDRGACGRPLMAPPRFPARPAGPPPAGDVDRDGEIGYARSEDAGATRTSPVAVHAPQDGPPGTPFCLDKPMIAVGPAPRRPAQEAARVFWSADAAGGLRMPNSVDGGATWSAPVTAAEGTGADVALDGTGGVHVGDEPTCRRPPGRGRLGPHQEHQHSPQTHDDDE